MALSENSGYQFRSILYLLRDVSDPGVA
jgi:hypothetical protein